MKDIQVRLGFNLTLIHTYNVIYIITYETPLINICANYALENTKGVAITSFLNPLTNNMTINLNVFGPLMKHGIGRNVYGNLIITIHTHR